MQLIYKKGPPENRFKSRYDSRVPPDSLEVNMRNQKNFGLK